MFSRSAHDFASACVGSAATLQWSSNSRRVQKRLSEPGPWRLLACSSVHSTCRSSTSTAPVSRSRRASSSAAARQSPASRRACVMGRRAAGGKERQPAWRVRAGALSLCFASASTRSAQCFLSQSVATSARKARSASRKEGADANAATALAAMRSATPRGIFSRSSRWLAGVSRVSSGKRVFANLRAAASFPVELPTIDSRDTCALPKGVRQISLERREESECSADGSAARLHDSNTAARLAVALPMLSVERSW
mmetsp:Transcript_16405/g.64027  ORF Transcript_16405/g.64027 Transcript_16405/m.64027 type:complete len:254 (-) Transcript_16405:540-1301(-)